ncbi:hypothetical protein AHAS_Ahas11G0058600 [Arachis hypogaea]
MARFVVEGTLSAPGRKPRRPPLCLQPRGLVLQDPLARRARGRVARQMDAMTRPNGPAPDKAPSKDGSSINQLLGIKGAAQESNKWKIRLQLTKPVTWPPLVWGVITQIWVLLLGGLGLASLLDVWAGHDFPIVFYLAMARGWITSVIHIFCSSFEVKIKWMDRKLCPRSKLHQFTMVQWAGQALFGTLTSDIIFLTLLYSIAGLGIAMVNDFKSVEGDRALGLQVNAVTLFLSITVT